MSEKITRGTLLRMAGNVAAGMASRDYLDENNQRRLWTPQQIAVRSWEITMAIIAVVETAERRGENLGSG